MGSAALLATVAVVEKKVPPRHPLQRLNKLTMFSEELMNDWFGALPSKDNWIAKFATNAGRTTRTKCRMEAPRKRRAMTTPMTDMTTMTNTDDDVPPTTICDTTPKIPALEPSRPPPDSPSGPSATSETARDRKTTSSRSTEWNDGTTDSVNSSIANKSCTNSI